LEKIDAKNLSTESSSFVSDGKTRIVASEKEQWFSLMSKILFEKKQYDQCLLLCEEALASFPQLHYNNDIWFPNRIANCYLEKGKIKEAANKLEELMKHKENWVVYDSMFKVKQAQNDLQGMLKYASAALLATGEDKSKIKLVLVFGKVLQDNGMTEQAFLHYIFARNIRWGAGWPDDNMLLKTIAQFGLAEPESKTIKKQLGLFWKQQRHGGEVLYHGVIDKILPNNKAGFIKDAKGKSYYFRISSFKADKMKLGTAVQFYVEESFDRKKNKNSQCAVDVTVVQ
jgi:tetratricopeptide (TPR) repeat protein